jgi:hypothetical protein
MVGMNGRNLLGMAAAMAIVGFYPIFRHDDWLAAAFIWSFAALCLVGACWKKEPPSA